MTAAYREKARRMARVVTEDDLLICACDCALITPHAGMPENYDTVFEAAKAFYYHSAVKTMYWAVHYKGGHILTIKGLGVAEAGRATLRA